MTNMKKKRNHLGIDWTRRMILTYIHQNERPTTSILSHQHTSIYVQCSAKEHASYHGRFHRIATLTEIHVEMAYVISFELRVESVAT